MPEPGDGLQRRDDAALCPSAQPGWTDAIAIGVVGGTADGPEVSHFPAALPITPDLLRLAEPVTPAEVFRFAAPCLTRGCQHYKGEACHLVARVVSTLGEAVDDLPRCAIRPRCQWWRQEGPLACRRCPQIVTDNYNPSEAVRLASDPVSPVEGRL